MKNQQQHTCPMHSQIVQDKPGTCPIFGMNLVIAKESESKPTASSSHQHGASPPRAHEGHDQHARMINDFKKRFWVSLILTVPILLLSEMMQHWLGDRGPGDYFIQA